jgi:uncharacterized protein YdcH (DUF465 family)
MDGIEEIVKKYNGEHWEAILDLSNKVNDKIVQMQNTIDVLKAENVEIKIKALQLETKTNELEIKTLELDTSTKELNTSTTDKLIDLG